MEHSVNGASSPSCGDCKFFDIGPDGVNGWCHFNPPTAMLVGMRQPALAGQAPTPVINAFWAPTSKDQECGRHAVGVFRPRVPIATAEDVAKALANVEIEGSA